MAFKSKGKSKGKSKSHPAVKGLQAVVDKGSTPLTPADKIRANDRDPTKGLRNALKAAEIANLSRQVAVAGGG